LGSIFTRLKNNARRHTQQPLEGGQAFHPMHTYTHTHARAEAHPHTTPRARAHTSCTCTHTHTHAPGPPALTCTHARAHTHRRARAHTCSHTHSTFTRTHPHAHARTRPRTHACIYTHARAHRYARTHARTCKGMSTPDGCPPDRPVPRFNAASVCGTVEGIRYRYGHRCDSDAQRRSSGARAATRGTSMLQTTTTRTARTARSVHSACLPVGNLEPCRENPEVAHVQ
jgi:hypothetical protein